MVGDSGQLQWVTIIESRLSESSKSMTNVVTPSSRRATRQNCRASSRIELATVWNSLNNLPTVSVVAWRLRLNSRRLSTVVAVHSNRLIHTTRPDATRVVRRVGSGWVVWIGHYGVRQRFTTPTLPVNACDQKIVEYEIRIGGSGLNSAEQDCCVWYMKAVRRPDKCRPNLRK